ncbi:hypothetical protein [Flavobacterium bizetiae]|uniref:hypothetical protein n=1 Tax=Flavobacterium bizetiae TaxID=2704140 RepID=UPI00156DEE7F|nr:hypothetical protein [Flavobacterium bizetiae]
MVSTTGTQRKSTTRIQAVKMFNDTSPVVETTGYIDKTYANKKHSLWFQPQEKKKIHNNNNNNTTNDFNR